MRIYIETLAGQQIANLQERDFSGLKIETVSPGGYYIATFAVPAEIGKPHSYRSLMPATIHEGPTVAFDGYVAPGYPRARAGSDELFDFALYGWAGHLAELETHGLHIDVGGKASTFISDWMHEATGTYEQGDPYLKISAGDIQTTDAARTSPIAWEHATWRKILDDLEKDELWEWSIWGDRKINWRPLPTMVEYYIRAEDATFEMDDGYENIVDMVILKYRAGFGDAVSYAYYPDTGWTPPADRLGRRVFLEGTGNMGIAQATTVAQAYYDYYSAPHIKGPITCTKIYDSQGARVPLYSVRAGKMATLLGYRHWETLDSFRIKRTSYEHDTPRLTLEREEESARMETMLANILRGG